MASFMYDNAKAKFFDGSLDWDTNVFKVMAVTSGYAADQTHVYASSVVAATNEINGTGYTRGFGSASRKTLTPCTVNNNTALHRAELKCTGTPAWTALNAGTIAAFIIIKEGTSDTDTLLIAYLDAAVFSTLPLTTNGSDVTLNFDSTGIFRNA